MSQALVAQRKRQSAAPVWAARAGHAGVSRHSTSEQRVLQRRAGQCACGGGCPRCRARGVGQAELHVNAPDDPLEREADRIADAVLNTASA